MYQAQFEAVKRAHKEYLANKAKMSDKPIHAKPSLYAFYYEELKAIGKRYGYNIVIHGSMNRDLDLIAIPWEIEIGDKIKMLHEFAEHLGGRLQLHNPETIFEFAKNHHGREIYVIDLNRGGYYSERCCNIDKGSLLYEEDKQYYIDISIMTGGAYV